VANPISHCTWPNWELLLIRPPVARVYFFMGGFFKVWMVDLDKWRKWVWDLFLILTLFFLCVWWGRLPPHSPLLATGLLLIQGMKCTNALNILWYRPMAWHYIPHKVKVYIISHERGLLSRAIISHWVCHLAFQKYDVWKSFYNNHFNAYCYLNNEPKLSTGTTGNYPKLGIQNHL